MQALLKLEFQCVQSSQACLWHVGTALLDNGMEPRQHEQQLGLQGGGLAEEAGAPSIVCALQVALHPRWSLKAHLKHLSVSSEVSLAVLLDAQNLNCAGNSLPAGAQAQTAAATEADMLAAVVQQPSQDCCSWVCSFEHHGL